MKKPVSSGAGSGPGPFSEKIFNKIIFFSIVGKIGKDGLSFWSYDLVGKMKIDANSPTTWFSTPLENIFGNLRRKDEE